MAYIISYSKQENIFTPKINPLIFARSMIAKSKYPTLRSFFNAANKQRYSPILFDRISIDILPLAKKCEIDMR